MSEKPIVRRMFGAVNAKGEVAPIVDNTAEAMRDFIGSEFVGGWRSPDRRKAGWTIVPVQVHWPATATARARRATWPPQVEP